MNMENNGSGSLRMQQPQSPVLYHDGCNVCLDIARTLMSTMPGLEIVDLQLHPEKKIEAAAIGIVALPCLVVGSKLMPVAPHSQLADIGHDDHEAAVP